MVTDCHRNIPVLEGLRDRAKAVRGSRADVEGGTGRSGLTDLKTSRIR